jgi:hypothetical protein
LDQILYLAQLPQLAAVVVHQTILGVAEYGMPLERVALVVAVL